MYICCTLELRPPQPATDIFIAALGELGFESFEETPEGVKAYIPEENWDEEAVRSLPYMESPAWEAVLEVETIAQKNWNAAWESGYQPIRVGDRCMVRAPFHPEPDPAVDYDLVIAPKMSFGTGHHQTTWLMLAFLLEMELAGKALLDMGSGTGVLAILAAVRGAEPVTAVDIDPWSYENCRENAERNGQSGVQCMLGGVEQIEGMAFDTILANINKNVLLDQMAAYGAALNPGGQLLLSGFYRGDQEAVRAAAETQGLQMLELREKEDWIAVLFGTHRAGPEG